MICDLHLTENRLSGELAYGRQIQCIYIYSGVATSRDSKGGSTKQPSRVPYHNFLRGDTMVLIVESEGSPLHTTILLDCQL